MSSDVKTIQSIIIVGGGSSGWMAAAYLSKVLVDVHITLIESPTTPVIGVGEATIPFLRNYLERIGFPDDRLWMPKCEATYKTGILFENWFEQGDEYWHPFEYLDYLDSHVHTGHCWLHLRQQGHPAFQDRQSFYSSFFPSTTLNARHYRAPSPDTGYAYHFDAHLFGELLRSTSSTVRHILDNVVAVRLDETGSIEALSTGRSGDLTADLYIDCSGFRGVLINQVAPEQRFICYADSLFCDRAVVLRVSYANEKEQAEQMAPFVRASAQSAGWLWTIPLYRRLSFGYVYSSHFIGDDEAELELRRYCGEQRVQGLNSLRLKFRTGKLERSWVKNCVAIGLAGGFIEPLESTGLAITQMGVEMLASMLDARYYEPKMIGRYNAHLDKFYTDIVQFIIAHYCFTSREDSAFWQAVKHETFIPADLAARLRVFQRDLPTLGTKGLAEVWMFRDISWFCVLLGMNFPFDTPEVSGEALDRVRDILATKRRTIESRLKSLPNHFLYLKEQLYEGQRVR